MPKGKVKWFNNAKGYGFILPSDESRGEDLFIHYSSINMDGYKTLKAGQQVSYDIIQGPKGLHAVNIIPIPETDAKPTSVDSNNEFKSVSSTTSYATITEEVT